MNSFIVSFHIYVVFEKFSKTKEENFFFWGWGGILTNLNKRRKQNYFFFLSFCHWTTTVFCFVSWLCRIIICWLTYSIWNCQFSMRKFRVLGGSVLGSSFPCLRSLYWLDYPFQAPLRLECGPSSEKLKNFIHKIFTNANEFLDL